MFPDSANLNLVRTNKIKINSELACNLLFPSKRGGILHKNPPLMEGFMYLPRIITKKIRSTLAQKSVLLLGPRQTGKSSLIREELKPDRVFNLLDQSTFLMLTRRPSTLRESLKESDKFVVIDEIQKLPSLMDEVHLMIEEMKVKFLLTGSSARKLRRSYTKLMGGRTRSLQIHPFVYPEIRAHFDLKKILSYGTLPNVFFSTDHNAELTDYVGDYLQQEIVAEALTRGVDQYSRFLSHIASCAVQTVNIEGLSRDSQISPSSTRRYLEILSDTMIATQLECWKLGAKRKAASTTKLVFFDVGVVNTLLDIPQYSPVNPNAGMQLEQYIGQELLAYRDYSDQKELLNFWRSTDKFEVDFILNDTAIEVKHSDHISEKELKGLAAIDQEGDWAHKIVVSRDPHRRKIGTFEILPVQEFLEDLWAGRFKRR